MALQLILQSVTVQMYWTVSE